ncbi:uncharacterized protein JCM10292_000205 [Rhodotorula paludigena]|uniref:uncharacterized protein n=1 Tax=Rhodotorula paludigena TaxID=86838 RepID=UPI00317C14E8
MTDFASPSCGYPEGYAAPLPVASTSASFGTGNGSTRIRLDQHTVNDETASASVKPFISKLYHLLSHPDSYQDCVVWDGSGNSFIINSNKRFARDVLPQVFGHSNIASFTRQLNVYGFRRMSTAELMSRVNVTSPETYSAWQHALFTRDDCTTLHLLCPRPSRARVLKKAANAEKQEREREDKARRTRTVQQQAANAAAHAVGVGPGVPALAAPPVLYPPALQPVPALAARRPYVPYAFAPPPQPSEADRSETSTTSFESSMPLSPVTPPAPPSLELHGGDSRMQHSFSHSTVKGLGQYRW